MKRERLICTVCGKGSSYKVDRHRVACEKCGYKPTDLSHVSSEDRHRVRKNLCVRCYKKEMRLQMVDEIGGFLGNRDWHGAMNLVAMAKDIQLKRWAWYFGATEKDIFRALKRIQREDDALPDFEDGDKDTLEG